MKKNKWILKCILGSILFLVLAGLITMLLWNWLVPALFGGPQIKFFQALGLLLLSKILFGGWGRGRWNSGQHSWKRRYEEKLSAMSPEARERFKSRMREKWRCGDTPARDAGAGNTLD